jgi:hypothetical protein
MSKTHNKSTTDFPSGIGSGGSQSTRDNRIQIELETATDTFPGGSYNYGKK